MISYTCYVSTFALQYFCHMNSVHLIIVQSLIGLQFPFDKTHSTNLLLFHSSHAFCFVQDVYKFEDNK